MKSIKKRGLLYHKVGKFQQGAVFGFQNNQVNLPAAENPYSDSSLFGEMSGSNFLQGNYSRNKNRAVADFSGYNAPKASVIKPTKLDTSLTTPTDFNKAAGNLKKPNGYNFGTGPAPMKDVTKAPSNLGNVSGKTEAATGVLNMAGDALSSISDGKDNKFTNKEKAGVIGGTALKSAATGASLAGTAAGLIGTTAATSLATTAATSVGIGAATAAVGAAAGSIVPIVGTAIGLVIGAAVGIFKAKKAKKKAAGVQNSMDIKNAAMQSAENRNNNSLRDSLLVGSTPNTSSVNSDTENIAGSYPSRKFGGTFHYTLKKKSSQSPIVERSLEPVKIFKRGGGIKPTENIIPNGVLHEEENKLGDKGMPVVKCTKEKCVKKYEIEKEEMIFTLDTTKKVEALVKGGDLKKLGTFVKEQVLDNTHSFTDKFNDLNNYKRKNESIHA